MTARHSFSEEPEFRNIKNLVLKTALEISNKQMGNQQQKKNQIQNEIIRNHLIRLLKEVSNMVVEDYEKQDAVIQTIDRKLRQKIREKKEYFYRTTALSARSYSPPAPWISRR